MKKLLILAMAAAPMLLATGCKTKQAPEIRVGVVQAQTGMFGSFGQGGVYGIQQAVSDINKMGGVQVGDVKMPIKLIIVDDESDPNKAGQLAESLITQDNVNFIISGDEPPHMHAGVSQACDRYKIPYITNVGPFEPWMGMRSESPTKWQYTWAAGLMAIATPAPAGDFRAKPGYTVMDTWKAMLDLYGAKTNKKSAFWLPTIPTGGDGTRCLARV